MRNQMLKQNDSKHRGLHPLVNFARAEINAKKTVDQAAAEYKVPAKYKGYIVTVNAEWASAKANLEAAYKELKK